MAPTLVTSCNALPPEANEPVVYARPALVTSCNARGLAGRRSPEASLLSTVQTCSNRFGAAVSSPSGALRLRPGKAGSAAAAGEEETPALGATRSELDEFCNE